MKHIKLKLSLALVCVVLGIMVTLQYRTVNQGIGPVSDYRAKELASQLKKVREERDKLITMKNEYEVKIREYENSASQGSITAKMLKKELDNVRILAGLEDVQGPGITVKVDDLKFAEETQYALITYSMLLEIVNELNAAGAEAISINDQRVVSNTEIRQTGGIHININMVSYAPPFEFKVIGDPKTLEAALRLREGVVEKIESYNIAVTITQEQLVNIPKYNGVIEKKYAQAVKEGDTE